MKTFFNIRFFTIILSLYLTSSISSYGQANIEIEVNWPFWSSENQVTFRDPLGTTIAPVICDTNNGGTRCFTGLGFSTTFDNIGSPQTYTNVPYGTNYTLFLEDNFGDGWNGAASIRVYQDGIQILEEFPAFTNNTTLTFDIDPNPIGFNTPVVLFDRFNGYFDYTTTGGVYRTSEANPCLINTPPPVQLSGTIPATATIEQAYLFWAHSGITPDQQVTFEGQTVNAQITNQAYLDFNGDNNFFGMIGDVTTLIQGIPNLSTNNFDFTDLTVNNTDTDNNFCSNGSVLGGWSLFIFYTDPSLPASRINLYNGFAGQRNTTSNFSLDSFFAINPTGAKTTILSWEGDIGLANNESLTLTAQPSATVTTLSGDRANPGNNPFNSSRYNEITGEDVATFGLDLDTYDLSGGAIAAGDTEITTNVGVGDDFVIMNAVVLRVPSNLVVGIVYEDVNYPGGAGRNRIASAGVPIPGATVELYDSSDNFVESTTTDSSGEYLFGGMINGTYKIRVVNSTVTSSRGGGSTCTTCLPIQTFRRNFASSALSDVANEVGGANPSGQDSGAVTTVGNPLPAGAQTISTVSITDEGAVDLDFGFNFNTIVNTNEDGQGSLEQFIINSNNLDQTGLDIEANSIFNPAAGDDTSIFMIPTNADPLGRTTDSGYNAANGYFDILTTTNLSAIVGANGINTEIDGRTQTAYSGDTNTTTIGSGGTNVGISATTLPNYSAPEIQVQRGSGNGYVFDIQTNNTTIRNIALFANNNDTDGIRITSGTGTIIQSTVIGTNAIAVLEGNTGFGIRMNSGTSSITENYITQTVTNGIIVSGGTNTSITLNQITTNGGDGCNSNVIIQGGTNVTIQNNLIENASAFGINDTTGNVAITNNTITGSGQDATSCTDNTGIALEANNTAISNNIITANNGSGIILIGGATSGNLISQNSIFANGATTPSLGIDINNDGVTINDTNDVDAGPNTAINFPVFESLSISGNQLKVIGWSRPGATIELFLTDVSEGTASTGDNQITGPSGAVSQDYGEGQTYLATIVEGSASDTDATTSLYNDVDGNTDTTNRFQVIITLGSSISTGNMITATATIGNSTSEFSGGYAVGASTVITNRRITYRVK